MNMEMNWSMTPSRFVRKERCIMQVQRLLSHNDIKGFLRYVRAKAPSDGKSCQRHSHYRRLYGMLRGMLQETTAFRDFYMNPTAIDLFGRGLLKFRRIVNWCHASYRDRSKLDHLRCLCFECLKPVHFLKLAQHSIRQTQGTYAIQDETLRDNLWVFYTTAAAQVRLLRDHYERPMSSLDTKISSTGLQNLRFGDIEYRKKKFHVADPDV